MNEASAQAQAILKKNAMVKVANITKSIAYDDSPVMVGEDVVAQKRRKVYEDTLKSWSVKADKDLAAIRATLDAEAKNISIEAVVNPYQKLNEFESTMRGLAHKVARKAASAVK